MCVGGGVWYGVICYDGASAKAAVCGPTRARALCLHLCGCWWREVEEEEEEEEEQMEAAVVWMGRGSVLNSVASYARRLCARAAQAGSYI